MRRSLYASFSVCICLGLYMHLLRRVTIAACICLQLQTIVDCFCFHAVCAFVSQL